MTGEQRTSTTILGVANPTIIAFNRRNRERRKKETAEFKRLNSQFGLAAVAHARVLKSLSFVQSAQTLAAFADRFRNMPSYQNEMAELAPADEELIIQQFKQSSPLHTAQRRRSELGRVKLGDSNLPLRDHIKLMFSRPEHLGKTPWELWPHLWALLDELGCDPKEISGRNRRTQKITYDFPTGRKQGFRSITFGQFSRIISDIRRTLTR
jgi:hypothetical protein